MPQKNKIHFEISERKILLRIFDIVFVLAGLFIVGNLFDFDYIKISPANWPYTFVLILYISVFGTIFELYDLQKASKLEVIISHIVLTASVTVLFYLLTPFFTPELPENRLQIVFFYLAFVVSLTLWRWAYTTFISSPRFYKKVLIVGEISNIEHVAKSLIESDPNYKIIGFINCEEENRESVKFRGVTEFKPTELNQIIKEENLSEIVVASYNAESITPEIYNDLIALLENGFTIREYTQVYEELTNRIPVQYVGKDFYKYFPFSRSNQNKFYLLYGRVIDILFSLIGLIVFLILVPFLFTGNLIGNRGPLFYSQERVGKNGVVFRIIKLRTMVKDAEKDGIKWAEKNDVRTTKFGKFLRLARIDELPQFLNVLKGEMSLIGPRPERPFFVKELSQVIPFYETRHIIKPGLTGWAQVKANYGSSVDDSLTKLQYDLFYIKRRSFFLDVNIIIKTLSTIIFFKGQ